MEKSIVEQCREYYPMTFYPDSLAKLLNLVSGVKEQNNSIFSLEPIPLIVKNIHYYNEVGLKQFWCGCSTALLLVLAIVNILLTNRTSSIAFLLLTAISFWCYCSLHRHKNNLRKTLIAIEQKLSYRQYKIKDNSSINTKPNLSNLLLDSLAERENIYNFKIDDSANKGLSESYFLSYLQKWFDYPWRIIEHCQFQGDRYTPTADFILINDDLKLGIDLGTSKEKIMPTSNGIIKNIDKPFTQFG